MPRPLALAALLLLAAAPAAAQLDAPSKTDGFSVGAYLHGTSFDTDDDDDQDAAGGGGLGLEMAYGFSSGLALFLDVQGGELNGEDGLSSIERGAQVDLGGRVSFGGSRRSLVPFLEAALTYMAVEGDQDVTYSGTGVTVGGGLEYFLSRRFSLKGGLRITNGGLNEVEVDGDSDEIADQFFSSYRFVLGGVWHP